MGRTATGDAQDDAVRGIALILPDARAALDWLLERNDIVAASRLVRAASAYWSVRSPREGLRWFRDVVPRRDVLIPQRQLVLLAAACWEAADASDFRQVRAWGEDALALAEREGLALPIGLVYALCVQLRYTGQYDRAREVVAAGLANTYTDEYLHTILLLQVSNVARDRPGDDELAPSLAALALAERLNNPLLLSASHVNLAFDYARLDTDLALHHAMACLHHSENVGIATTDLSAHLIAAAVLAMTARHDAAVDHALACTRHVDEMGAHLFVAVALDAAALAFAPTAPERAARLCGAADEMRKRLDVIGDAVMIWIGSAARDTLVQTLGQPAFDREMSAGRSLRLDDIVALLRDLGDEALR